MNTMNDLTAAWDRAASRTTLPNSRLMQELERIRTIARLYPGSDRASAAIDQGISTFDTYTAATDIEIARMAYRGVIRLDQDPQGDLDRTSANVMLQVAGAAMNTNTIPAAGDRLTGQGGAAVDRPIRLPTDHHGA